jgi:hypothetical protein
MRCFYFVQDRLYLLRFSALDLRVACSGVRLCIDDTSFRMGCAGRYYTLPHLVVYTYRDHSPLSLL